MLSRFEKYQLQTTCGACPERISVLLGGREVAEFYVRDGEMELRAPQPEGGALAEVYWREDIRGWGAFKAEERDHYMHEAIRRFDKTFDPEGRHGELDPDEPVPAFAAGPELEM